MNVVFCGGCFLPPKELRHGRESLDEGKKAA